MAKMNVAQEVKPFTEQFKHEIASRDFDAAENVLEDINNILDDREAQSGQPD